MKARLAAEAEGANVEDKYVTSLYVIMREFGCADIQVIKNMPATTYFILLEEMEKQAEREKEAAKKSKPKR